MKKKKKVKTEPDEEPLTLAEQNLFLLREMEAQKHTLIMQTNKAGEAETVVRELRAKLLQLQQDNEAEKASVSLDVR